MTISTVCARRQHYAYRQRGAVLLVAMVFLLLLSILGISMMRSGQMQLLMAGNEQSRLTSFELTEGIGESIMEKWKDNFSTDKTICKDVTASGDCDTTKFIAALDTAIAAKIAAATTTYLTRHRTDGCPLRGMGVEVDSLASFFDLEATYDNTANRQGKTSLVTGVVVLNPVGECSSSPSGGGKLDHFAHVPTGAT